MSELKANPTLFVEIIMPSAVPYINNDLHAQAIESLVKHLDRACQVYGPVLEKPFLNYNLKGTCAGLALPFTNEIRLNPVLFAQNIQFFLSETIPHELAHLLTHKIFGPKTKPHGPEWRSVMRQLGVTPKTTHDLDVSAVKRKVSMVQYRCACTEPVWVSAARHKKVQALKGRFICRRCSQVMRHLNG